MRAYVVACCPSSCIRLASCICLAFVVPNHWADWVDIWHGALGQLLGLKLYKWGRCPFLGYRSGGTVVECPLRMRMVVCSNLGRVIPKTLKMVVAALSLGAQHFGSRSTTSRSGVSIMWPVVCLGLDISVGQHYKRALRSLSHPCTVCVVYSLTSADKGC